ncbi:hypothetical protein BH24ACI1_BH24ACI1_24110 [soil metagenome]|jgi:hypothetical protein
MLAKGLNLLYLDTEAMHCGVGLAVLKNGVKAVEKIAEKAISARR